MQVTADDFTVHDVTGPTTTGCAPYMTVEVGPVTMFIDTIDDLEGVIAKLATEHERIMQDRGAAS